MAKMSDYSDDDFEMSGSGNVGTFDAKQGRVVAPPPAKAIGGRKPQSPFRSGKEKAGGFKLANDDDDEYGGYGGGPTSGGDEYEEDDFDEEEEEQFKKTAVEFAKKLTALRESTNYQLHEGGEDPNRPAEENKGSRSVGRPTNNNSK